MSTGASNTCSLRIGWVPEEMLLEIASKAFFDMTGYKFDSLENVIYVRSDTLSSRAHFHYMFQALIALQMRQRVRKLLGHYRMDSGTRRQVVEEEV